MSKVFTGSGRVFQEVQALALDEEGLREVEQRLKLQPHFLGEPLVVIGEASDFPQALPEPGHHLLALDVMGRAVVISLAAGVADTGVQLEAQQLAAYVSNLKAEDLGKIARSFIDRPANEIVRRAWDEMGVEMSDEGVELTSLVAATFQRDAEDYADIINTEQRLIIAAEGFTARLVAVIRWLVRNGVNLMGLRYRKYMVGGQEVYFAEQVVPTLDPAVDAPEHSAAFASADSPEPWRVKGRAYHLERLTPAAGNDLDELLVMVKPSIFTVNWSHKYYFWVRGSKRNLRVRTYFRDQIEIGFHNASPEAVRDFLAAYGLEHLEVVMVGGYTDSPFVSITPDITLNENWARMLNDWLLGVTPKPGSAPGPESKVQSRPQTLD